MRISPTRISKGNRLRGFSMLELLVVITLLSVVMLMSVPAFTGLLQSSVDKELERLRGVVRLLRNEAILKRREMRLVFDLAENGYLVEERAENGEYYPRTDHKILNPHKLDPLELREVVVYGSRYEEVLDQDMDGDERHRIPVVIDVSGFVDPFQIHLVNGDESWTLKVAGLAAKITVEKGYVEPRG